MRKFTISYRKISMSEKLHTAYKWDLACNSVLTTYPPCSSSTSKSEFSANSVFGSTPTATITWSTLIDLEFDKPKETFWTPSGLIDNTLAAGIT